MADVHDPATRSRNMAAIRGKNTKPELVVRRALHAAGFRFRLHGRHLPGRPDIVLPKWRAAVFVHGCYWHRHRGCRYATTPDADTSRTDWGTKFEDNVARDRRNIEALRAAGWRAAVIWECEIRRIGAAVTDELAAWLKTGAEQLELPGSDLPSDIADV